MSENLAAFLYGDEYTEKMQKFDNGVSKIENENSELFEKKKLSSHYVLSTFQNNTARIMFTEDTLPRKIVNEVINLFECLFPKP